MDHKDYKLYMEQVESVNKILHELWMIKGVDDEDIMTLQSFVNTLERRVVCPVCKNKRYIIRETDNHGHVSLSWGACYLCNRDFEVYPDARASGSKEFASQWVKGRYR